MFSFDDVIKSFDDVPQTKSGLCVQLLHVCIGENVTRRLNKEPIKTEQHLPKILDVLQIPRLKVTVMQLVTNC